MAYRLPVFNLICNIYTDVAGNPLRLSPACNLAWGDRANMGIVPSGGGGTSVLIMTLLLPALTDIRSHLSDTGPDTVEVPAGSGRKYLVAGVDDIGKGFANEHRCAAIYALIQPTPLP